MDGCELQLLTLAADVRFDIGDRLRSGDDERPLMRAR